MSLTFSTAGRDKLTYGKTSVFEVPSEDGQHAVVFEDDGTTGHFYAIDPQRKEQKILDSLLIYNVAEIEPPAPDDPMPEIVIGWSVDGMAAMLLINNFPQAIFDFAMKQGYCRSGFPKPTGSGWSNGGHNWDDTVLKLFMAKTQMN